jgi:hypothetical protein
MYRPVSSASVAEDITFLMMCAMFRIAPLFGETVVSLERKKCPLLSFVLLARPNSLHHCVLLAPCHLHGRRVQHLLAWPVNQEAVVFVALCLRLIWMTVMLWC